MKKLRIFVSSPGDVVEERVVTRRVLERVSAVYGDRIEIEPVFWEHEPLRASGSFQEQIPQPADCDVVLMILWSRLGTRLPANLTRPDGSRYASGTEFEFENALEAWRARGVPDLLVYRKTARPFTPLDSEQLVLERLRQKKALDAFLEQWFMAEDGSLTAAFHAFEGLDDFEQLLEIHLRKLIEEKVPAAKRELSRRVEWTSGSPYRGLEVFRVEHSPIFFGRTRAISEVLNALRLQSAQGRPFVLVLGMSGCGKSSLVRAGVLPLLTQPGVIEGVGLWRCAVMRPADAGGDLFSSLASALLKERALPELAADGTGTAELSKLLRESPDAAFSLIKGGLSQAASAVAREEGLEQQPEARLALVIDQLEELFTMTGVSSRDRQDFVAAIESLVSSGKVWVLATMRSDFYPRMVELPGLVALKEGAGQYDLLPASPAEIGQMIRRPAELAGLEFEESEITGERLDDALRDAAARNPEALPLLQFTLEQLYAARSDEGLLTLSAYEEMGGVAGALAQRAEAAFDSLRETDQSAFATVMSALIMVGAGEGDSGTRQWAPLSMFADGSSARALVDRFVEARLLVTNRDDSGKPVVAVAHEALLRHWPRLEKWLEHNRELLQLRQRLDEEARRWEAEGRPASSLLASAKRLAEADELEQSEEIKLPEREHDFLQASLAKGRRSLRLKRAAVAALFILAVVAAGAAYFAEGKRIEAEVARGESEAVTDFLGDMLASVDPEDLGRDVLVKDVLDEASTKINELEDQALIQARLMNTMGNVYKSLGLFEQAQPLLEGALQIRETEFGPNDLVIAGSLNNLGNLLLSKGDYEQAKRVYERALAIRKAADEPDQLEIAISLNSLANVLARMGENEQSLQFYEQSLAAQEQVLGPDDPQLQIPLNNLGLQLSNHGRLAEARPYLQRAAELSELELGPDHPRLAVVLTNIAILHARMGEYGEARPLFERALQIQEKAYGPDHHEVGAAAFKLGILNAQTGHYDEALSLFERGAAIKEKTLGPKHPDIANDLNNLATLHKEMGNPEAALPLFERALAIREEALGADHPSVAISLRDLATVLVELDELERPRPLFERALHIQEAVMGAEHKEVAITLMGYGNLLHKYGDDQGARLKYEQALRISEKALGADHPEVALGRHLLAGLLRDMGELAESETQFLRALEIREEKLGPNHPHVADSLEGYARLLKKLGRDKEALDLESRAEAIRNS